MLTSGDIIKTVSGRRIGIGKVIKAGGQGTAYYASDAAHGQAGVIKDFHKKFRDEATLKRIKYINSVDLRAACPVLCAPTDVINKSNILGHFTPMADGCSLEEHLVNPNFTFSEGLQLGITLAHALNVMHTLGIAHGDLHAENLIVNKMGNVFHSHLIDFDNFNAPGLPAPPCVGQNLYMAPELRFAMARKQPAIPNIKTDLFSLGVLMHEIILLCHPATGNDDSEEAFQKAMCSGKWSMDPAVDKSKGNLGGFPASVLNADLARLFRFAISINPDERPSAHRWEKELKKAFNSIYCCPKCGGPVIIDVSKTTCPLCGHHFPCLTLRTNGGRSVILSKGSTVVGRTEVGGSQKVSLRHAVFRRIGPETWFESMGRNGSYRWSGSDWIRLPENRSLLVQAGDRLRFGDVEIQLN